MVALDVAALVNFLLPGAILLYVRSLGINRKTPLLIEILVAAGVYFVLIQTVSILASGAPYPLPTMERLPKTPSDGIMWAVLLMVVPTFLGVILGLYSGRDTSTDKRKWYKRIFNLRHPFQTWRSTESVWTDLFRINKVRRVRVTCKNDKEYCGYAGMASTDPIQRDFLVCPTIDNLMDKDGIWINGDEIRTIELWTVDSNRVSASRNTT